nr:hypothetical protein [uncultured archaeon]
MVATRYSFINAKIFNYDTISIIMIEGIGVDIEEIQRFKTKKIEKFLNSVFTKREIAYCENKKDPSMSLAGKFCAKEAVIKASKKALSPREIEILNKKDGKVKVYISGSYKKNILCSISHTKRNAIAFVIISA